MRLRCTIARTVRYGEKDAPLAAAGNSYALTSNYARMRAEIEGTALAMIVGEELLQLTHARSNVNDSAEEELLPVLEKSPPTCLLPRNESC